MGVEGVNRRENRFDDIDNIIGERFRGGGIREGEDRFKEG